MNFLATVKGTDVDLLNGKLDITDLRRAALRLPVKGEN